MYKIHSVYKITNPDTGWYYILKHTSNDGQPPLYIDNRIPQPTRLKFPKEKIFIEELGRFRFALVAFECRKLNVDLNDKLCLNRKIGFEKGHKMPVGIKRRGCHKPKSARHKLAMSISHKKSAKSMAAIQKAWPLSPMNKKGRPAFKANPP